MDHHELDARLRAGRCSERSLAAELDVSNQTVNRWRHGRAPIPDAQAEAIDHLLPPAESESPA